MTQALDDWSRTNCKNRRPITLADGSRGATRCYARDPRKCVYCAQLNRLEMKILIGSGCNVNEAYGVTEIMLEGYDFYWDTLTAPSFGKTHRVPASRDDKIVQCGCGQWHAYGDEFKGVPIDRYDRRAAVEWNSKSSELIAHTFRQLKRRLPEVEFAVVREYQARGSIHLHYIVRVPSWIKEEHVITVMNRMRKERTVGIGWGKQSAGAAALTQVGREDCVRYMAKVVGYTAKAQGLYDNVSVERMRHYDLMARHAQTTKHTRACDPATCGSTAHRNLGFKGHILTMSQGWSLVGLTRKGLAERRREWVQQQRELEEVA